MTEKIYQTPLGGIRYWIQKRKETDTALIFLPGLTADHRLFQKQISYFRIRSTVLVWDPPGHGKSWPFRLDFSLMDQAKWLHAILKKEKLEHPVLIGQSMGGYVGQAFLQQYPDQAGGFIAIDSAPLQRRYATGAEIWMLKRMEPVYRRYPWKLLKISGSKGCAVSRYGRHLMHKMMMTYEGAQDRYARLSGLGFRMLADAIEADLPYRIMCPALLICGEKDRAGSTRRYNRAWHKKSGIPIRWVKDAGHNANTDQPELVNQLIAQFLKMADTMENKD